MLFGKVDNDNALLDIDLGCRQTNAARFIHGFGHVRSQLADTLVHRGNGLGNLVQALVGVDQNRE